MLGFSADPWAQFLPSADPRYALGLSFIVVQCLVWILAAVVTQWLYEVQHFDSPFLLSYIGMSFLALLLPFKSITDRLTVVDETCQNVERTMSTDTIDVQWAMAGQCSDYVEVAHASAASLTNHTQKWNHRRHFTTALVIAPAMFTADWAFNQALSQTSVASATVLVSMQSVFVCFLAVILRLEPFSWWKLLGVVASVLGTALTTTDDVEDDALTGDLMALGAAALYATYTIEVRLFCPEQEDLYSMPILLGYIGLVCAVGLAPFGIWLLIGQTQLTLAVFGVIVAKGLMDFAITDYCLFRAIILTNPTVATVGLGLTIPMAFLADFLLGKAGLLTMTGVIGAVAVSIGFLAVNLAPEYKKEKEVLVEQDDQPKGVVV